ncbi:MAG: prepilin-type N-terminal cleavage/methylation domain-containing protein [Pirellulaceae bacterium]|jgi:prepilin-type N-terminal cleavage/methylation domain-containing protein
MKVRTNRRKRSGFSLLELLAVVTILGIIAVVVIPRISVSAGVAKTNAHKQNIAEINSAVERWYFEKGTWPAADLSDIIADSNYFPDGLPKNPTGDGTGTYALDTNHRAQ